MALPLGLASVHDERRLLKWIFGIGIALITVFLAITNGTGAWVATKSWAFTGLAIGAEIALVAAFSLIVLGETRWRQAVGALVFIGLAWFCVENGKAAVKHWMSDVFIDAPESLRSRADLADAEATKLDTLPTDTKTEASEQRRLDREELAALNVEPDLMTSSRIAEAQRRLTALGLYEGRIDGIRAELTEAAMRARGETIRNRMAVLQSKLDTGSAQDSAVMALAPAQAKREEAITLRAQADEAGYREWWAQILLLVAEAARSFGVWAFLMAGTRDSARYGRRATDRVEDEQGAPPTQERETEAPGREPAQTAPVDQDEAETQAPEVQPEPEPAPVDDLFDEPANDAPVETEAERQRRLNAQKGGLSNAFGNEVSAMDDSIPVDPPGMEQAA
jgi:hypothetical protein